MRKYVFGGIVVAALFTGVAAIAASVSSTSSKAARRGSFFTSDQNRADVSAHIERLFKGLDLNHDGFITRDEIAAAQAKFDERTATGNPKRAAKMFDRMDTNHDGKITQDEIDAARAARAAAKGKTAKAGRSSSLFARADTNKDGIVTRAEFDAAIAGGKIKLRHANMLAARSCGCSTPPIPTRTAASRSKRRSRRRFASSMPRTPTTTAC